MKNLIVLILSITTLISCKNNSVSESEVLVEKDKTSNYESFGAQITAENALTKEALFEKYKTLKKGDTLSLKYASKINEVCSKKGCWMKNDLGGENDMMVRFKDYRFFMPLDAAGRNVIVEGKAFVTEISVEELQHYAEDAGKSKSEIAAITTPEYTYAFLSNGVLIQK